jgi:DNA helicase-2/ATP-dependent DNA helicase PcrA
MSFHKSKGLTADLVVLDGLVDGLMPRIKENASDEERRAQFKEQRRVFFVGMTRATRILVFSSYSQLASDVAHNLRARRGRYIPRDQAWFTFASPFLEETGPVLPGAVRGQDWLAALGYV